jgi:hypothetical protein
MLDLKRYHRLQPHNLCGVEKDDNGSIIVFFKRFDNETGAELSHEPHYVNKEDLEKDALELTNQLTALTSIINAINHIS